MIPSRLILPVLLLSLTALTACDQADPARPAAVAVDPVAARVPAAAPAPAPAAEAPEPPAPELTIVAGAMAPDLDVASADGAERISLAGLRGKYVVLDVWATWCGPCLRQIPGLERIHEERVDDPRVAVLSVSVDAEAETLREFLAERPAGWLQGHVPKPDGQPMKVRFEVKTIPTFFVIDPEGRIVHRGSTADDARNALDAALAA